VVPAEYRGLELEAQEYIGSRLGIRYYEIEKVISILSCLYDAYGLNYRYCRDNDRVMCLRCREGIVGWLHAEVEKKMKKK